MRSRRSARTARRAGTSGCSGRPHRWLAEAVYRRATDEAAEHWLETARRLTCDPNDLLAQIAWRSVRQSSSRDEGQVEAGRNVRGGRAARAQATDALNARAAAFMARAEVLRLMDEAREADEASLQGASRSTSRKETLPLPSALRIASERPLPGPLALIRCSYIARTSATPPCGAAVSGRRDERERR